MQGAPSFRPSRRALLKAGIAGAGALAVAQWWRSGSAPFMPSADQDERNARSVIAAIVPALLDGALPPDSDARADARTRTVDGVMQAVAGLPPGVRAELAQLFTLLSLAPFRWLVAGVRSPWREASKDEVDAFLRSWRGSGLALLHSGYDALHQLVMAAWYAQESAWPAIGYEGPPNLGTGA